MIIMLLLFSNLLNAQDTSSERYCFASSIERTSAEKQLNSITVPSDKVSSEGNCLVVQMFSHRRELIQRYLLSIYPQTQVSFSSAEVQTSPCLLKVEKIRNALIQKTNVDLNKYPSATSGKTTLVGSETMQIQTLNDFKLEVGQEEIAGRCRYITPDRYEITLTVKKNPLPLVPENLPPGTIVVIKEAPAPQKTMELQTQVQIRRGEKIEVGQILRELKTKDQGVSLPSSVGHQHQSGQESEKVFLTLQ